ncbi:MAG TPA: FAD-dependent oxidoreductase [Xanthobacteraceae bacterium]|jgi:thioredoxin reductase (NADPH)
MPEQKFDVVVAGGGIAGLTAGLVAARVGLKTLVMTGDVLGGQLLSIERIDGYPGFPEGVPGYDLCPMVQEQASAAGAAIEAISLGSLKQQNGGWQLGTGNGGYSARAVVLATGTTLKELGVEGEERLRGHGVSHCATCDAPLLRDRVVGVVGGGDSALQESLTLAEFASRVIVFHRGKALSAQAAYQDRVSKQPKIEIRLNTVVEEVLGESAVTGVRTRDLTSGAKSDVELSGFFVYVGLKPNAALVNGLLDLDASGRIATDAWMRTRQPGILAAGTVRSGTASRAVSAAGDGTTAAIAAEQYLKSGTWRVQ